MTRSILLFIAVSLSAFTTVYAEIEIDGAPNKNLRLVYSPEDGNLELLVSQDTPITILRLISEASRFTGEAPPIFEGLFDFYRADTVFKLDPAGFGSMPSFGNLGPGRSLEDVAQDLSASGAMLGSGGFDRVGGIFLVPEPSTSGLLVTATCCLLLARCRKTARRQ